MTPSIQWGTDPNKRQYRQQAPALTLAPPKINWAKKVQAPKLEPTGPPQNDELVAIGSPTKTSVMQYATQSLTKTAFGEDLSDVYDKITTNINEHFPEEWKGSKAVQLTERVGRAIPEAADFLSSPVGVGLAALHLFKITKPAAIFADRLLQGYQIVHTIPSVIEAVKDPSDMDKVGDALKDIAFTYSIGRGLKTEFAKKNAMFAPVASDRKMSADNFIETMRNAPLGRKYEVLEAITTPRTAGEKRSRWMYETPIVRDLAAVLDVPKPKLTAHAASWMDDRRILINTEAHNAAVFVNDWKRIVPEADQDIRKLGYVLEGTHTADEVGLSEEGRRAIPAIREWNRQVEKLLKGAYGEDVKLHDPETYLMHKLGYTEDIDINNQHGSTEKARYAGFLGARRSLLRDPQMRPRIPGSTWYELLEGGISEETRQFRKQEGITNAAGEPLVARIPEGMAPVSDNVFDLIKMRHQIAATAIANQRFANTLRDLGLIVSEQKAEGPVAMWPKAEATALERAVYGGRSYDDETILVKKPVRVHPALQKPVEAIFGKSIAMFDPNTGKRTLAGYADWFRAFGKQNAVGISLFHHWAISEQVHAIQIGTDITGKGIPKALKGTFLFDPQFWKGLKSGIWEVRKKGSGTVPPVLGLKRGVANDAISHGLNLGTADAEGAIVKALRESTLPILKKPLRFIGNLHYINNRGLWDFYLPGQMINSYETILSKELARNPNRSEAEIASLKREVTNHLNKVFGTEGLDAMFLSPRTRYWMNFFLFAPVWTFSNFRVVTNGFQTEAGHKLMGRWVGGAAFAWFVTSNLANYALSGWTWGQGPAPDKNGEKRPHFMWDNPGIPQRVLGQYIPGMGEHSTDIFFGYNPNGSESYIRFGRAYRDVPNFFNSPREYVLGKLGLPLKAAIEMATGREASSDYQVIDRTLPIEEQLMQYATVAGETVMPFVLQDMERQVERIMFPETVPELGSSQATIHLGPVPIALGLPTRSGLTTQRAIEAYDLAKRANRNDLAEQVLKTAVQNHIPRSRVLAGYRDKMRRRAYTARGPVHRFGRGGEELPAPGEIVQPPETR